MFSPKRRCSNLIELFKGDKIINFVEKSGDWIIREFELIEEIQFVAQTYNSM